MRFTLALAAGALALTTALTGCSSSSDSADGKATSSSSATQVLPPVLVAEGDTTAQAKVGDTVVFNVANPVETTISVDNADVLEIEQGRTDGSATFNPGAKALKKGTAVVTIEEPGQPTRTVEVTVS